jgi:hypothetical protein
MTRQETVDKVYEMFRRGNVHFVDKHGNENTISYAHPDGFSLSHDFNSPLIFSSFSDLLLEIFLRSAYTEKEWEIKKLGNLREE